MNNEKLVLSRGNSPFKNNVTELVCICVPNDKRRHSASFLSKKGLSGPTELSSQEINTTCVIPGDQNAKQCFFYRKKGSFSIYIR